MTTTIKATVNDRTVVDQIVEWQQQGLTHAAIADELNRRGVTTARGGPVKRHSVPHLLANLRGARPAVARSRARRTGRPASTIPTVAPKPLLHTSPTEWARLPTIDSWDDARQYILSAHAGDDHGLCAPAHNRHGVCGGATPEVYATRLWVTDAHLRPGDYLTADRPAHIVDGDEVWGWEACTPSRGVFARLPRSATR